MTTQTRDGLRTATRTSGTVTVRRGGLWLTWGQNGAGPRWQDNGRWAVLFSSFRQAEEFCVQHGYEGVEYIDATL